MKSIIWIVLLLALWTQTYGQMEVPVPSSQLPSKISDYINKSFNGYNVLKVVGENNSGSTTTYEIYLNKEIVLNFDGDNNIISIDGRAKLPDTAIQPQLVKYVNAHYNAVSITDWEWKDGFQMITLDNGDELRFSKTGEFLDVKKSN